MFNVYVIANDRDKIYVGYTANLDSRIKRHNGSFKNKRSSFTYKNQNGTWRLVYREEFSAREEAVVREKQLKSCQGRNFIRALMYENFTRR